MKVYNSDYINKTYPVKTHLDDFERKLSDINLRLSKYRIVQKIFHLLPFLRPTIGLTSYQLGEGERVNWNKYILRLFHKNSRDIKLIMKNGFYEVVKSNKKHLSIDRYYFPDSKVKASKNISAIYLTGSSARLKLQNKRIKYLKRNNMNAIVFDIKDVTGFVNYQSNIKLIKETQEGIRPPIFNLKALLSFYQQKNVYSIARIALFQDERLLRKIPQAGIYYADGRKFLTKGRAIWVDAAKKVVQDYNLNLIWEVLKSGVDEIQLDYVRYPAEGDWKNATYKDIKNQFDKKYVLSNFLRKVYSLTKSYQVALSLDVFGVVAWQERVDIKSTGQDMRLLGQLADVISPMLYPSHFGKVFGNVINPADSPYKFIKLGCEKLKPILPENTIVRPWLQAFKWRVTNYTPSYISKQVSGAVDAQASGFLLWNANNRYDDFSIQNNHKVK